MYCTVFSDTYLDSTLPPRMAIAVATPCPATAPPTTPSSQCTTLDGASKADSRMQKQQNKAVGHLYTG